MAELEAPGSIDISADEINSVRRYILSKNTAVLTVMFTDIQGFTEVTETRGEEYSKRVRERHDRILVDVIQEGGAGLVVKFIGDAVMAVFSEPSLAVERALLIQERLGEFNASQDELDDILVRIGVHMGQVAVEDSVQTDVFGRHVNRAARIESLAAGGQIYLSYAVFDSARGWLQSQDLQWHLHGDYVLKGISEPVAIYEVCGPGKTPVPPAGGKRKRRGVPGLVPAIALVLAGGLSVAAYHWYQRTEVWLARFYPERLIIDGTEPAILEGERSDEQRRIANAIGAGRHVLHYDVDDWIRYYAEVDVARGANVLTPKFEESRLPQISHAYGIGPESEPEKRRFRYDRPYFYYDAQGARQERAVELSMEVSSRAHPERPDVVEHSLRWKVVDGGRTIGEGAVSDEHDRTASDSVSKDAVTIGENSPVRYYYQYRMRKEYIYVKLAAVFSEYAPR